MRLYQVQKYPEYKFINLDLLDTCATTNNLLPIERFANYTFVRGDIGNMDLVPTLTQIVLVQHCSHPPWTFDFGLSSLQRDSQ
jgi:dTDP-D-glucose 4,6-dehydratase